MSDMRLLDNRVSTTWCQVSLTSEQQVCCIWGLPRLLYLTFHPFFLLLLVMSSVRIKIFQNLRVSRTVLTWEKYGKVILSLVNVWS
jgi:hypothetical protein